MCYFYFYLNDSVILFLYAGEIIIKGFKLTILVKGTVIIYIVNLQYVFIIKVINVNCKYYY